MSSSARTPTQQETQTEECTTLGCRNTPVGAGYCAECVKTSPNLVEDTNVGPWAGVDFSLTQSDEWPSYVEKREQWMGRRGKRPFAPWGDSDAPAPCSTHKGKTAAECDCDGRWKWGFRGHYKKIKDINKSNWDCLDDGMVFLQREDDPIVFVDGDEVRDPVTGNLHPEFLEILNKLGLSYADVSVSGTGVHVIYRGELPENVLNNCAEWDLDDTPFGSNNETPSIEIYAGKHVCVMTGEHVINSKGCACEWDEDALHEVLDDAGQFTPSKNKPARNNFDPDDYTPTVTGSDERTDSVEDIFYALDTLNARAVAEKTIVHSWNDQASTSGGSRAFWPTWGKQSNGTANVVDEDGWIDTGTMGGCGGPVIMALIDLGNLAPQNAHWRSASGEDWWNGVTHLRNLGFDIPEHENELFRTESRSSQRVIRSTDAIEKSGWWNGLTKTEAQNRTTETIAEALNEDRDYLIEALPSMGKSFGSVKAAAQTGEPITILTTRGREEQYGQIEQWCETFGLSVKILPSVKEDCPTFAGEYGIDFAEIVNNWYEAGATGQEIHRLAEREIGEPLPCNSTPNSICDFKSKWDFESEDYDVIAGHYSHGYVTTVTEGRTILVDEFPSQTYVDNLQSGKLTEAVSAYLSERSDLPFSDFTDLIENRHDEDMRTVGLGQFTDEDLERDGEQAFMDSGHALAPLAVYALLKAASGKAYDSTSDCDLGNGIERAILPTGSKHYSIYDREDGSIRILTPPSFGDANNVVALDGTPTPRMWELALGRQFEHERVLDEEEYAEYIHSALEMKIIRTSGTTKPYSSGKHVTPKKDYVLFSKIADEHNELPALLTTKRAIEKGYEDSEQPVLSVIEDYNHWPLEGSNEFAEKRVGVVVGSRHFGDRYIQHWGAFAGECVERDGKGADLSYSGIGDDIYKHMVKNQTMQAIMRFGRDGDGATVYIHSDTLPDWVPIVDDWKVSTFTNKQQEVMTSVREQDEEFARKDLDCSMGKRGLNKFLGKLTKAGVLDRERKRGGYRYKLTSSCCGGFVEQTLGDG